MYGMNIFEEINMSVDWHMVYWGIMNGMLNKDIAQDYVCKKIEQDECISDEECELSWKSDDIVYILETIEKIPGFLDEFDVLTDEAKEKIQTAIIIYLRKTENDILKLFEQVDILYADMGYPQDMNKCISYMPVDDDYAIRTLEENRKNLLNEIDNYIKKQKEKYNI